MPRSDIFHPEYKARPYWWEAYEPTAGELLDVPKEARVAIVGGGYAGLAAALEFAKLGVEAVVLERGALGIGASTRNGGSVSGGVNIGKSFSGRAADVSRERADALLADAADAFSLIERLIEDERIECFWQKRGRFVGAWTPKHYEAQEKRLRGLNDAAQSGATMVPRDKQRDEIASDYYHGGMVVERSASLHPALYYKGLLEACRKRGARICAEAAVETIAPLNGAGWRVMTSRGTVIAGDVVIASDVVIATNGYTGSVTPALRRRVVPIASHIIATEELPGELAGSLIPKRRSISDTKRVLCYYRLSPDGKRMVFGGRARFTPANPELCAKVLHGYMTARFPQLRGARVTHSWTGNTAFTLDALPHMGEEGGLHYALGCNGSGVAMMTYLGTQTARKIARVPNAACAFDGPEFPDHPLYTGNPWFLPLVGGWYRLRDRLDRLMA
ncbi:MAG: FAD-binding oxidoreductase [Alphaproteobacteria bacterium]|nr:FAD-binding oxidoreductase [Alphaproteobacteria bacterium]